LNAASFPKRTAHLTADEVGACVRGIFALGREGLPAVNAARLLVLMQLRDDSTGRASLRRILAACFVSSGDLWLASDEVVCLGGGE
jgi:hypothetical protein